MFMYKLIVKFAGDALKTIYEAGEKLVITKEVAGNKGKSVTWVSTSPFENNVIEWSEDYLLYASRQETQGGAIINKLSETSAIAGTLSTFRNGTFQDTRSADCVGKNEYGVQNSMNIYPSLCVGIAQPVIVNDELQMGNPINALTLPYNHIAVMSPRETVRISLAANVDNGVVITKEFSNSIVAEYSGEDTEKTIVYDYEQGIFVPA